MHVRADHIYFFGLEETKKPPEIGGFFAPTATRCFFHLVHEMKEMKRLSIIHKSQKSARGYFFAEGAGFEPANPVKSCTLSKRVPSTTRPPFLSVN